MDITSFIPPIAVPPSIDALNNAHQRKTGESFQDALNTLTPAAKSAVDAGATSETTSADRDKEIQRLKKVGQDFEALFFSMMLKEMRNSISSEEGGGMFAGEGSDTYGGMFDTFIGEHMATSGQLGLAELVTKSLVAQREQKTNPEAADTITANETKEVK